MIEVEDAIGPVTFHVAPPAIESFVIATPQATDHLWLDN